MLVITVLDLNVTVLYQIPERMRKKNVSKYCNHDPALCEMN